jgi:hypothetical protein
LSDGLLSIGDEELLSEADVAVEGLEDVLPGADGVRAANADGLAGEEAADEVGDEAVGGPVAATDDVASAGGGDGDAVLGEFGDGEIRLAVGGGDDFGARLGARVGVVAAQRVGLAVAPHPFLVLVAFVGGDGDHGADGWGAADGVEDAGGADDVGFVGEDGIFVGEADERLSGEMEDDLGGERLEGGFEGGGVTDVAADVFYRGGDAGGFEEARCGAGV